MAGYGQSGRIKCIHVIHSLEYGGAQRDLFYYAKFHDRDRYELEVVVFHPQGAMAGIIEELGVEVHTLGKRSSDPRSIFHLCGIFSRRGAHVAHFHNSLPLYAGVPAAALSRVPVKVMTEHSIYHSGKTGGRSRTALYRCLRRRLDMVIACSEEVRRSHEDAVPPGKLTTVLNGVDLDQFDYSPGEAGSRRDEFHIGSIGSLTPQKGYHVMLRAVEILAARSVPVRLTVLGEGPLRDELENQAAASDLEEKVVFAGSVADVAGLLPGFDVVAGSSLREGLPLSILEAMAAGRPVVAADVGGVREAVEDGITGLLVPPDDPRALADALETIYRDVRKREEMGRMGRERAQAHFSARRMVGETEKIYESILLQGPEMPSEQR